MKRTLDAAAAAAADPTTVTTNEHTTTYAYQPHLKRLPVPDLASTLKKFIHTVAPIVSPAELEEATKAADDYVATVGPAHVSELCDYAKNRASYVEEFWDDAYLRYDAPVVINVNPIFVLEDDPTPSRSQAVARAVSLTYSSLKFVRAVRLGLLTPDKVKDTPLCMSQYARLFASARVPDPNGDEADVVINSSTSTHIVVLCRSQIYYFDVFFPPPTPPPSSTSPAGETTEVASELAITERELMKNLELIVQDARQTPPELSASTSVGVLTTESRSRWRRLRKQLASTSSNNRHALDIIDSALFVLCLDVDYQPESVSAAAANLLHGSYHDSSRTLASRWYDKLQLIVTKGGSAGVNFEHSACDGHTVLRYASDVFTDTVIRFAQTISGGIASHLQKDAASSSSSSSSSQAGGKAPRLALGPRPDVRPRKLEFDLTPDLKSAIRFAEARLGDAILQNDTTTVEFEGFGKTFLVQNGLSPDATVQQAIQYAHFNMYGEPANVYESVLTKAFFHGRTEAGRSCTPEAVRLMGAYCAGGGPGGTAEAEERIRLLHEATKAHTKMTSECAKGLGVDRLLYALECHARKYRPAEKLHPLFATTAWKKLNESVLSTSNCGNPSLRYFGFGPVCPNGFGVGYIIKDDAVHLMITSKHRQTSRFRDGVVEFLERVHDDLMAMSPPPDPATERLRVLRLDSVARGLSSMDVEGGGDAAMYDFFGVEDAAARAAKFAVAGVGVGETSPARPRVGRALSSLSTASVSGPQSQSQGGLGGNVANVAVAAMLVAQAQQQMQ